MQEFRQEDILQAYYPHAFTFNRDDVRELDEGDIEEELPVEMCDPGKNGLFVKSRVFYDENQEQLRYRKEGSPRKRNDWRSDAQERNRQDDVRFRDRHHYKKKEKKREEIPVWTLPQQWSVVLRETVFIWPEVKRE